MKIVILAGGKGERLRPLTDDKPKPLVEVAGKPMLDHQLELARRYGMTDILLLTGHLGEVVEERYGDGRAFGVRLGYMREPEPLGTAGAVRAAWRAGFIDRPFMLFFGDIVMDVALDRFEAFHSAKGAVMTVAVAPTDHPHDSDLLRVGDDDRIVTVYPKPHPDDPAMGNLANAALYAMTPDAVAATGDTLPLDFGREVVPALVAEGRAVFAYQSGEFIKDAGTHERLANTEREFACGLAARLNSGTPRPAAIIDARLAKSPDTAAAIRQLNEAGILVIVTGDGQIDDGFERLACALGEHDAYVTRFAADTVGVADALQALNADRARSVFVGTQAGNRASETLSLAAQFGASDVSACIPDIIRQCGRSPD